MKKIRFVPMIKNQSNYYYKNDYKIRTKELVNNIKLADAIQLKSLLN